MDTSFSDSGNGKVNSGSRFVKVTEELNDYFTYLANDNGMNANVLIAENGKIVYKKSFGYSDFAGKKLNTEKSLFPLASLSKTFTAIAVLQLKEKGKLRLDDALAKYLPDFPYPEITIRHLLSHTSGLPDTDNLFEPLIAKQSDTIFSIADVISALINYKSNKSLLFKSNKSLLSSRAKNGVFECRISVTGTVG